MGPLLLLMLVGGLVGGEILARLLPRWGHPKGTRSLRLLMRVGAAAYGGALLTASLTRPPCSMRGGRVANDSSAG